jgi:hypothetical protein
MKRAELISEGDHTSTSREYGERVNREPEI